LESTQSDIASLAEKAQDPYTHKQISAYPHFYALADKPRGTGQFERLTLEGKNAHDYVDWLTPAFTKAMNSNEQRQITLLEADGTVMSPALLTHVNDALYYLDVPIENTPRVMTWLRALVDGYVQTDDVFGRLPFLDAVNDLGTAPDCPMLSEITPQTEPFSKPYFIGAWSCREPADRTLPKFTWHQQDSEELRKTLLYETHKSMGARMVPFGGWEMPVWYTSNSTEHIAVRQAAGLFDVSHMGCWDVQGSEAVAFLNLLMVNDISMLSVGESQYSAFFDIDGIPLDDLIVYRLTEQRYFIVVNAANNDRDWEWVNAVLKGEVIIDTKRPWVQWDAPPGSVILRDLRDSSSGADMRMELAIQGRKSRDILLALEGEQADKTRLKNLPWAGITQVALGGFDIIVSRTGYTGERVAYELFVHPETLCSFWDKLLEVGKPSGLVPCGLAARDSLRIEAGLPLYGHEMAGPMNLTMADAGFQTYIKLYKPFFIGREAFIERESLRDAAIIRFRVKEKGQPMPQQLDPVVDNRGKIVGKVTSCAIDTEGYLLGQAYVKSSHTKIGTSLSVLVTPRRAQKPLVELNIGDRVTLPVAVEVLSRFPK
jgi:glycine hydroxymethyltransferase